jgi:hypothetical protein
MSDPQEDEDDMPDDKDSSRSVGEGDGDEEAEVVAIGDGDGDAREEEEEEEDDFFDAGEGALIGDHLSLRAASRAARAEAAAAPKTTPSVP